MASIEVVDDRYRDYPTLGTPTLIADDFFNAGCVLGGRARVAPARPRGLARPDADQRPQVGDGPGRRHPRPPARGPRLARRATWPPADDALRAGEFVTLGSVVTTQWVAAGDDVRIEIDGLGEATRPTFE